jgi:hypothetical protein
VISSHSGNDTKTGIFIRPKKLSKQPEAEAAVEVKSSAELTHSISSTPAAAGPAADASTLRHVPEPLSEPGDQQPENDLRAPSPKLSGPSQSVDNVILIAHRPIELPQGLALSTLKARLNGSKVKGQYLTPDEMYFFTKSWRPYRSLGECTFLSFSSHFVVFADDSLKGAIISGGCRKVSRRYFGVPLE